MRRPPIRTLEALDVHVTPLPLVVPPMHTIPRHVAPSFASVVHQAEILGPGLLRDTVDHTVVMHRDPIVSGSQGSFYVGLSLDPTGVVAQIFGLKKTPRRSALSVKREGDCGLHLRLPTALQRAWDTDEHPLAWGTDEDPLYTRIPLCSGDMFDAATLLWRHCASDVARVTWDVLLQLATQLEGYHANGVWHRDIKLENIFFERDGSVHLADLGLAVWSRDNAHDVSGTYGQMPLEQLRGDAYNEKADMFALGATIMQLVLKYPPFAPGVRAPDPAEYSEEEWLKAYAQFCEEHEVLLEEYAEWRRLYLDAGIATPKDASPVMRDFALSFARIEHYAPELYDLCKDLTDPDPAKRSPAATIRATMLRAQAKRTPDEAAHNHRVLTGAWRKIYSHHQRQDDHIGARIAKEVEALQTLAQGLAQILGVRAGKRETKNVE